MQQYKAPRNTQKQHKITEKNNKSWKTHLGRKTTVLLLQETIWEDSCFVYGDTEMKQVTT